MKFHGVRHHLVKRQVAIQSVKMAVTGGCDILDAGDGRSRSEGEWKDDG